MKSLVITLLAVIFSANSASVFADGWLHKATGGRMSTPSSIQRLGDQLRPKLIDQSSWQPVGDNSRRAKPNQKIVFGDGSDFQKVMDQRERQKRMEQQRRQRQQAQQKMMNAGNQYFQQQQQGWANIARQAEQLKHQFSNPNFGRPQYQQPYYQPYRPQPQYNQPQYNRPQYQQPRYNQPQYNQNHFNQYSDRRW